LRDGDEDVDNAISTSFVEDTCWWDPSMEPFKSEWPPGLTEELERQRRASS
jgi:hypothetical protein